MSLSEHEREKWRQINRDLIQGMRRLGESMHPLLAEVNRAAAKFADATWPMRYADDICEPEEDIFV